MKKKTYISYEEAQKIVQELNIKTQSQYKKAFPQRLKKLGLPGHPDKGYRETWVDWRDFLGTKIVSYERATEIVKNFKVKTGEEYILKRKTTLKKFNLPSNPNQFYKDKWIDWPTFLGNQISYIEYHEMKKINKLLKLNSSVEFARLDLETKHKYKIHTEPRKHYRNEWRSWEDFLGIKKVKKLDYHCAREIIKRFNINTGIQYREIWNDKLKEHGFPSNPHQHYADQWQGWAHFLGGDHPHNPDFISLEDFIILLKIHKIKSSTQYSQMYNELRKLANIRSNPKKMFSDWKGWSHFFEEYF